MFSNESSLPYFTKVEPITPIVIARVIGELRSEIKVPFGLNVLWDSKARIDLAVATQASFVREIFTGVYDSDFGLWNTDIGSVVRHQVSVGIAGIRTLFNIYPELAVYLGQRGLAEIARSTVFNCRPDRLCVSGIIAGVETSPAKLKIVKEAVPDTMVFANTGVNLQNLSEHLGIADGAVIGTFFKREGMIWNEIDRARVQIIMEKMKLIRRTRGL